MKGIDRETLQNEAKLISSSTSRKTFHSEKVGKQQNTLTKINKHFKMKGFAMKLNTYHVAKDLIESMDWLDRSGKLLELGLNRISMPEVDVPAVRVIIQVQEEEIVLRYDKGDTGSMKCILLREIISYLHGRIESRKEQLENELAAL